MGYDTCQIKIQKKSKYQILLAGTHRIGHRPADHLAGDGAVLPGAGLAHLVALGLPEALPGQRPLAVVPPLQAAPLLLSCYADGQIRFGGARERFESEVRDGVQVRGAEGLGRKLIL